MTPCGGTISQIIKRLLSLATDYDGQWRFENKDTLSANISMRTNEMGLTGPENPQLPRGFADTDRTSETAGNAKFSL